MRTAVHAVRAFLLILFVSIASFSSQAQSFSLGKFEAGLGLGPLFFLGDLGGNLGKGTHFVKDVNLPLTKFHKGVFLNYYPAEAVGFRIALNHGHLEGADSIIAEKGGDEVHRYVRNLHFRSKLLEAYAAVEFYPTVFFEEYDGLQGKLRPYGVIGLGVFKFNPQAQYHSPNGTSRWVDLQPLRIEGQGMKEYPTRPEYKLTEINIPMGFGVKYYVSDDMYLGLEVLHRKTFTDYIDDLSTTYINPDLYDTYLAPEQAVMAKQMSYRGFGATSRPGDGSMRGQSKNNDAYFSSVLRFGWRLNSNQTPMYARCPKF